MNDYSSERRINSENSQNVLITQDAADFETGPEGPELED